MAKIREVLSLPVAVLSPLPITRKSRHIGRVIFNAFSQKIQSVHLAGNRTADRRFILLSPHHLNRRGCAFRFAQYAIGQIGFEPYLTLSQGLRDENKFS
ncbi:MAG: hypothetical protein MZU91_14080 [Desulfosudis oleivorans]|nr:hypothetical protein [Desulfosudis oleivorans]